MPEDVLRDARNLTEVILPQADPAAEEDKTGQLSHSSMKRTLHGVSCYERTP